MHLRAVEGLAAKPSQHATVLGCTAQVFESPFGLVEELLADNAWQLLVPPLSIPSQSRHVHGSTVAFGVYVCIKVKA